MTIETNRRFVRFGLWCLVGALLIAIVHPALLLSGLTGLNLQKIDGSVGEFLLFASVVSILFFGFFPRVLKAQMSPYKDYYAVGIENFRRVGIWIEDPVNIEIKRDAK